MSDKERLEQIRNRMIVEKHYFKYLNSERGYWENVYTLLEQDMNYLFNTIIEQAERVEALEEENDELAERVHKLALDWSELVDERNRYKQALEYIQRAIYTQHCTKNHKWNTEFEKGQISGLIQASNIVDKAIRKVEGEV